MAEKDEKDEKEVQLVAVEGEPIKDDAPKKEDEEIDGEEEAESKEDLRLGADEEGTDEEKREARRNERQSRRARQHEARDRDKLEMKFLRQRNEQLEKQFNQLERRVTGTETSGLDARIAGLKAQIKLADEIIAKAIEKRAGEDAVEAQSIRDGLRDTVRQLESVKQRMDPDGRQEVDPLLIENANRWAQEHPWYDLQGRNQDSQVVSAIDAGLIREGKDPRDPSYWTELTKRASKYLPHRFKKGNGSAADEDDGGGDAEDDPAPKNKDAPKGGPRFSVNGRQRSLKSNEVYISPERKKAMEDAGVWDDPKLRQRMLKRYAEWDRDNSAR